MSGDDYRTMYDAKYLGAWDLPERDAILEIDHVEQGELKNERGTNRKPIVYFRGPNGALPKGLVLNKTNGKTIAAMYGPKTSGWRGKLIAIYATTTSVGGEQRECIRVRPKVPTSRKQQQTAPQPEPQPAGLTLGKEG